MKQKINLVVCILFGLMFINSGLNKIFKYIPVPDDLPEALVKMDEAFVSIGWLLPLVAVGEILGGILVMIPKTRLIGALIFTPILIGVFFIFLYGAPAQMPMVLIYWAILLWILYDGRKKLAALV